MVIYWLMGWININKLSCFILQCSDTFVLSKAGKLHSHKLWLCKQIDLEQRLRIGAEKLLQ